MCLHAPVYPLPPGHTARAPLTHGAPPRIHYITSNMLDHIIISDDIVLHGAPPRMHYITSNMLYHILISDDIILHGAPPRIHYITCNMLYHIFISDDIILHGAPPRISPEARSAGQADIWRRAEQGDTENEERRERDTENTPRFTSTGTPRRAQDPRILASPPPPQVFKL